MPDPRSVMKEFRLLDQKRLAEGLTPDEEVRLAELRDLVGPDLPAAPRGFDVNAAAARLRDSLLPAGLRNRPPPPPELDEPEAAPDAEPTPASSTAADLLAGAYAAEPFAPLEGVAADAADALFDPASLGVEPPAGGAFAAGPQGYADPGGWDPNAAAHDPNAYADPSAQAFDPNAQPYDPSVYADPNAAAYDPNAYAADPAAQAFDPNAQPYDPSAYADPNAAAYDPNAYAADPAAQALDPNAQPYDPNTYADPNAAAHDPNAYADPSAQALDPNAQPYDPSAFADPNAAAYDPNAYAADPAAQPFDPNAQPGEPGAEPFDPNAYGDPNAAAYAADPAPAGLDPAGVSLTTPAWHPDASAWADPAALEVAPPAAPGLEDEPAPEPLLAAAPGTDLPPEGWDLAAPPAPRVDLPLGEYDEIAAGGGAAALEALLPFDLAADAAIPPGAVPEGFGAPPGEYDDTAGFSLDAGAEAPGEAVLETVALEASAEGTTPPAEGEWQPDGALDQGFELESGGSFDATADAAAPEWAVGSGPAPWAAVAEPAPATPEEIALGGLDGDLAGPEPEPSFDLAGPAPELDRSAPDLSAGTEDLDLMAPAPPLHAAPGARPFDEATLELNAAPPLDLALEAPPAGDTATVDLAEESAALELAAAPDLELFAPDVAPTEAPGAPAAPFPAVEPHAGDLPALDLATDDGIPEVTDVEEIPTIDGEEILEEIPADDLGAPAASLDFDPLPAEPEAAALAPVGPAPSPVRAVALPDVPPPATPATPATPPAARLPQPSAAPVVTAPILAPPVVTQAPVAPAATEEEEIVDEVEVADEPAAAPGSVVEGAQRVVVHTIEGQVKRGVLEDADLVAASLALAQSPGAAGETLATEKVKAIFFMLAPGEKPPAPEGRKVRVTFRDGRQVAGFSPDYREDAVGFFMIPADTRTSTARIWVYRAAVRAVAVS
ncbi:DUF6982 domain-containing protein [Anaeromyxobacter oryzae]|uniref:CheA signal transduction histidine kinase n=1 Tax=Anaeromyxobacter oryzae TaxID=2918170 RepID=A0ABM7WVX4_9BACT|nr:chemotaxis protein CheA [Anaeromyxobacter oryzae]BDG03588.1 hypothetical protein AMOR_25840 [Anaeromyxobacter oryzae]